MPDIKYQGITLNKKLKQSAYIESTSGNARHAITVCTRLEGKSWNYAWNIYHYVETNKPENGLNELRQGIETRGSQYNRDYCRTSQLGALFAFSLLNMAIETRALNTMFWKMRNNFNIKFIRK